MSRVALFLFERASFTDTDSCAECRTKERDTRKWRDGKTDQFPRDKSSNCVLLPFLSASSVLTHWPDQRQALECIHLMRISTVGEEDTGESALCMEPLATLAASCFVGHLIFVWFLTAQSTGRRLRVVTRKLSGRLLEHRCGKTSAEIKCWVGGSCGRVSRFSLGRWLGPGQWHRGECVKTAPNIPNVKRDANE